MRPNKNWQLLLILSITVSIFSCESEKSQNSARESKGDVPVGGKLTLSHSTKNFNPDPMMMNSSSVTFVGNQIHGTLLKNSPGFEDPIPCIAERWEVDETGSVLLFHIRKGMTFHTQYCVEEPVEVTASHVVRSLTRICSPQANGGIFESFRNQIVGGQAFFDGVSESVVGLEALDDYRLKIRLNKPNEAFVYLLTEPATGIIYMCEDGNISSSGPFVPIIEDEAIVLIRNRSYAILDQFGNQLPYLDSVVFRDYPNTSMEIEGFFAGKIDVVSNIYHDPLKEIMDRNISDFEGKKPKYVVQRSDELASYDLYTLHKASINDYRTDYLGRPDLSRVTVGSKP